ncbi:NVEALA domain-containing protein [Proteiniphilum sp. X52]|uniref:NVEALA domain-containing protein n=1 Tax=Proteiniphilum sp. X52 TaxID=2382159 RepID=UPI000F0A8BD1|nr:NVEALA domain-containing protein [Proteiniphilum sp. X52]RNC63291.1 hypothetical protein D7D25_17305 [Proteiniphilum sp. X52]
MKKKILSGLFALALLATAGYGVNKSMNGNANLSDLALANVEALAQGEDFEIVCGRYQGPCWTKDYMNYVNCGEYTLVHPCKFTGYMSDRCVSPCQ